MTMESSVVTSSVAGGEAESAGKVSVLRSLESVCKREGDGGLEQRLAELRSFMSGDLEDVERALADLDVRPTPLHKSASHLLESAGKRLRPMCVALAARVGDGFGPIARDYAVAVELVHNATLLHDDVVDLGDVRRGVPTSRMLYGNASSIFAGDFLLVEALLRVRRGGDLVVLDRALAVLGEMLEAESLQLAKRGTADATMHDYLRVARGKTASLFRWAMFSGARAGGLPVAACAVLERYGEDLGIAFQVVDDVLDASGDENTTGKSVLSDLREGKATYPLLLAMERDREVRAAVNAAGKGDGVDLDPEIAARVARGLRETGALDDARAYARMLAHRAAASLGEIGRDGPAIRALVGIAASLPERKR
jgi:octaprenyl-diphosphate synthase